MSGQGFLSDEFLRQLISVGDADLLVALVSHNDVKTVAKVVQAIETGLLRNFPRERVALLNVDGGSRDGTASAVLEASSFANPASYDSLRTIRWMTVNARPGDGQGNTLRNVLAAADLLHAKACAVLPASLENPDPAWLVSLLNPVYRENYDFVSPLYTRHKFDGFLTRNFLYPFTRALYGQTVRELRATEFAFSGRLAESCLAQKESYQEGIEAGAEMWIAITAMAGQFRCCQTYLGPKSRQTQSSGVVDLIRHTVRGFFSCIESTEPHWLQKAEREPLCTIGADHQLTSGAIRVDRAKLLQMYQHGVNQLSQVLSLILDADLHAELTRLASSDEKQFQITHRQWVRACYEFAVGYHHSQLNRDHLVQAFVPIYRGRIYSFLAQHRNSSSDAMEADLEELCLEFEKQKDFFIERWTSKGQGGS